MPKPKTDTIRMTTGIPGLDKLVGGGFIPSDVYLVSGGTGCGKTIFCAQFLWEGLKKGESCIYFSLEEMPKDIIEDVRSFGWDLEKYQKENKLLLEYNDPFEMVDITTAVRDKIKAMDAKRVIIDSTAIFGMVFKDKHEMRKRLFELMKMLKQTGAVVILTSEIPSGTEKLSRFGIEEFIVDGVIILRAMSTGKVSVRTLEIKKMRRTKHDEGIHGIEITDNGIVITD